jgi:superfamily II DNA or RNA helicase
MLKNTTGLKHYQIPAAERIVDSLLTHGVSFDASDTGVGKTFSVGGAIRELIEPIIQNIPPQFFVVCPRAVKSSWARACDHFGIKPMDILNYEKLNRGNTEYLSWVTNNDPTSPKDGYFKWHLPKGTIIIFDEVHKCKGEKSRNGAVLRAAKEQGYGMHVMSATAATNPLEMYSIGYVLGLHNGNRSQFRRFCADHGCYGNYDNMRFDRESNEAIQSMLKIHNVLTSSGKMVRISRTDLGDEFPSSIISADSVDMGSDTDTINQIYNDMFSELAALSERTDKYTTHHLNAITKARRLAELQKVPTFVEMIEDGIEEGKSVAVFVNYTDTLQALAKRLSRHKYGLIVGGQKERDRDRDISDFQSGVSKLILVNVSAGNAGISLHDLTGRNERYSLISPSYSAIHLVQVLGRVWRKDGGISTQRILFAAGTVEERICNRVREKIANVVALNDGILSDHDLEF